jgi:hypothetical protein
MRTVRVYSTKTNMLNTVKVLDTVTNWASLRTILYDDGLMTGDMKAVIRETKATMELDDAVLPEGDFTIIACPTKHSGGTSTQDDLMEIRDDIAGNLRDLTTNINALIDAIMDVDAKADVGPEIAELRRIGEEIKKIC